MLRTIISFVLGVVVAFLVISGVDYVSLQIYPAPPGFELTNMKAMAAYVAGMPMPAMLLVLSGWCLGGFFGAAVPSWQANHRVPAALLIGLLIATGTWFNAQVIPHPKWMTTAGMAGPMLLSWLATKVIKARRLPLPPPSHWPDHARR